MLANDMIIEESKPPPRQVTILSLFEGIMMMDGSGLRARPSQHDADH
jgi:hypothetical protein